ncbi:hypothetical protein KUL152_23450 [Tenacibaculum sp. KUL152]|nr:hypothetical protein KUL152_23450 [Tenacibaculum sp. KUL152]
MAQSIPPEKITWQSSQCAQEELFTSSPLPVTVSEAPSNHRIPKSMLALFKLALCHQDPNRFALCYRVLWRVVFENKHLVRLKTDHDIMKLNALAKAVKRDAYKMSAFLRFREISTNEKEYFVAWYEPEHYSLELKLDFFQTRFKNMQWSIITPYRAAHWNTEQLILEDNPDKSVLPDDDRFEQYWLTYYANIFNPARLKKSAMLSSMPKKYWKNMPETQLIENMIKHSGTRARKMIIDGSGEQTQQLVSLSIKD